MGDVLNPTAGTKLDCGLFAGGVFKPECWCLSAPWLCSTADYQAAQAMANPDVVYAPIQQPPPNPAVSAGISTVPAPYQCSDGSMATAATNCPDYLAALAASTAAQKAAQDAQTQATMAQTYQNLQAIAATQPSITGANCTQTIFTGVCDSYVYIGGAALGIALVLGALAAWVLGAWRARRLGEERRQIHTTE
jgi:hypothetical protein